MQQASCLSRAQAKAFAKIRTQSPGRIQEKRTPKSGLQYSYGVDYRALRSRWIHLLDPPRAILADLRKTENLPNPQSLGTGEHVRHPVAMFHSFESTVCHWSRMWHVAEPRLYILPFACSSSKHYAQGIFYYQSQFCGTAHELRCGRLGRGSEYQSMFRKAFLQLSSHILHVPVL